MRADRGEDQTRDRDVGVCYLDDCADIGAAIIAEGLARDCPNTRVGDMVYETEKSRTLPFPKKICRSKNRPVTIHGGGRFQFDIEPHMPWLKDKLQA
jgi:hypothetical protein